MIKESNKRMLSLLFAFLLLLVSLYVFSSYVRPAFEDVKALRDQLLSKQDYLAAQTEAKATIDKLFAEFEKSAGVMDVLSTALPQGKNLSQSVFQIQALTGLNNLQLKSLSVELTPSNAASKKTLVKTVGKMRISVKLTGDYNGFKNFLQALEANVKLMDVAEMDISPAAKESGPMSYSLKVDTYYQE